jgi:hypothetical protein
MNNRVKRLFMLFIFLMLCGIGCAAVQRNASEGGVYDVIAIDAAITPR